MPQQPRAHGAAAVVEQAAQRRRRLAAQGFGQFEVAPGGGVQAQISRVPFDDQGLQVRQGARLRRLRVAQQRAGSGNRRPQAVGAEASQRRGAEMGAQLAARRLDVEVPVGPTGERHGGRELCAQALGDDDLGRADALQGSRQFRRRDFADAELATRQIDPRQPGELPRHRHREQQRVALLIE